MIITTACTGYVSWNANARSAARAPASSESNARIARCANRLSRRKCASPSAVPHVATAFSMPGLRQPDHVGVALDHEDLAGCARPPAARRCRL